MADAQYYEARRYSAVILRDSRLDSLDALLRTWNIPNPRATTRGVGGWNVTRLTYGSRRNHYPPSVTVTAQGVGHPHEMYVATGGQGTPRRGTMIVAAPYVRLLTEAIRRLDSDLEGDDALTFVRPSMNELFDHFERSSHRFLQASRIEVKMRQSGLDRVALSGRNPLRSDLRQALFEVSLPYSIRVRSSVAEDIRPTNVNIDLHGNVWWHLSGEKAWDNVVPLLDLVLTDVTMRDTRDLPLQRLADASDEQE